MIVYAFEKEPIVKLTGWFISTTGWRAKHPSATFVMATNYYFSSSSSSSSKEQSLKRVRCFFLFRSSSFTCCPIPENLGRSSGETSLVVVAPHLASVGWQPEGIRLRSLSRSLSDLSFLESFARIRAKFQDCTLSDLIMKIGLDWVLKYYSSTVVYHGISNQIKTLIKRNVHNCTQIKTYKRLLLKLLCIIYYAVCDTSITLSNTN